MFIRFQDEGILQKLLEMAQALKEKTDGAGEAKEAVQALQAAIERLKDAGEDDPLEALELMGKALSLMKKWAPEGVAQVLETYALAIEAIAGALKAIALTAYDKAIDKAYEQTGDPKEAAALADKLLPDTPAADRLRGLKRIQLRHLKKTYVPKKSSWRDWLPWNWLSSVSPGLKGAGALGAASLVVAGIMLVGDPTGESSTRGQAGGGQIPIEFIPLALGGANTGPAHNPRADGGPALCAVESRPFRPERPWRQVEISEDGSRMRIDNDLDGWCDEIVYDDGTRRTVSREEIMRQLQWVNQHGFAEMGTRQLMLDYLMPPPPAAPRPTGQEPQPAGTAVLPAVNRASTPPPGQDDPGCGGCGGGGFPVQSECDATVDPCSVPADPADGTKGCDPRGCGPGTPPCEPCDGDVPAAAPRVSGDPSTQPSVVNPPANDALKVAPPPVDAEPTQQVVPPKTGDELVLPPAHEPDPQPTVPAKAR